MIDRTLRVKLPPDGVVTGIVLLRRPTKEEHAEFLNTRFQKDGLTNDRRVAFIDRLLMGIEDGFVLGQPFSADAPNWKDEIQVNDKISIAVTWFEERDLTRDDEKKSGKPSRS